ncbi:ankyrin repeat domain-containing protein, partial [Planctomycetota bacterium]
CIDRGNGKIKWRKSIVPEKMERINGSNSHAAPTPVCDGKRVYVYFGSFGLLAYDVNGNELWRKPLPVPDMQHGYGASPILADGLVIINCDQKENPCLLAVDQFTGKQVWKSERPATQIVYSWSTPVLWKHGTKTELVVLGRERLIAYDLRDGRECWRVEGLPIQTASTPVYTDETLFAAASVYRSGDPVNPIELPGFNELLEMYDSDKDNRLIKAEIPEDMALIYRRGPESAGVRQRFAQLDTDKDGAIGEAEWNKVVINTKKISPGQMDALIAIRSGGKDDVSQSHVRWRAYEGIGQVPSPLFYQGRIYLVKHAGNVTCYDAKTGDKIYSDRVGPRVYYFASPVAADNKIYFCSSNGVIIVVQAGDKFKILAQNKIGERIYATPALVDGKIYLRTNKNMYAFAGTKDDSGQRPRDIVAKVENNQAKTLYEAAADGDIALVKSLISSGADVNTPNIWGWTPLYIASGIGYEDIVNFLIAKGADIDAPNRPGETPLHFAFRNGHKDIAELLIENGADFSSAAKNGITPLHTVAEQGHIGLVKLLIDKGADVNANTKTWAGTPLHQAAGEGHTDIVKLLIANGANVNSKNNSNGTPLHWAAFGGHTKVIEILIKNGAEINAENDGFSTPLGFAEQGEHTETVELLRKHGANMGTQPLIQAVTTDNIEQVKLLLSEGADVNIKPKNGQTPLLLACQRGKEEVVQLLIAKGADINTKNNYGQTPLHYLARQGSTDTAELIIAKGADVNAKDKWVWTPLHYACWRNRKEIVELLLAKGADINAREEESKTPMAIAEELGNTEIVELLRKHGAKE